MKTSNNALNLISEEAEVISNIKNNIFDVSKLQLHTGVEGFESPSAYGIYKKTGGNALGIVGKDFEPTQPSFMLDQFVDALQDIDDISLKGLTYNEIKGGKKVKFSCPIGEVGYINKRGMNDEMKVSVNLMLGFDGQTKSSMFISTYRMICANGMKAWTTEFNIAFKNTRGNMGKINMLCHDLDKVLKSSEDYLETIKRLQNRKISKKERNDFIKKVTGIDGEKYQELTTHSRNILDRINEAVAIEIKDAGATAWALLNGITRYTNHLSNAKNVVDYIYADSGMKLNENAQKVSFALLN